MLEFMFFISLVPNVNTVLVSGLLCFNSCPSVLSQIATRKAYGMALAKLGRYNERVVALDGDTKNSTFSELFKNEHPDRYVECYIAEQNMVRQNKPSYITLQTERRLSLPPSSHR